MSSLKKTIILSTVVSAWLSIAPSVFAAAVSEVKPPLILSTAQTHRGKNAHAEIEKAVLNAVSIKTARVNDLIPQLAGLPNRVVQDKLNRWLMQLGTTVQGVVTDSSKPLTIHTLPSDVTYDSNFNVLFRAGNILEIMFSSYYMEQQAAHGLPGLVIAIMDLQTGRVFTMQDLFRTGSPYLKQISQLIIQMDTTHELDAYQKFTGVTLKDGFFLTPTGFTIYFYPYEWTPYIPMFSISYTKVTNLLNTSGPLWRALQTPPAKQAANDMKQDEHFLQARGFASNRWLWQAQAQTADGQTLYAWNVSSGSTDSLNQVYFFLGHRYLGTDTLLPHKPITNIYGSGHSIVVYYDNFTIHFTWNGSRLQLNRPFPAHYVQ